MSSAIIRIMLVDDHAMIVDSLRMSLEREPDIQVVGVARSVADAFDCITTLGPDVILMDHYLPDGDGITAAAHISA
jgi:DNA-binding NarL/FixJ family response regulator